MKTPKLKLTSAANSSRQNKTGGWRTKKPLIDHNTCIGCGLCAKFCPEACIIMTEQKKGERPKPQVDYDYCKGCGLCAHECPVKAIKMEKDF